MMIEITNLTERSDHSQHRSQGCRRNRWQRAPQLLRESLVRLTIFRRKELSMARVNAVHSIQTR